MNLFDELDTIENKGKNEPLSGFGVRLQTYKQRQCSVMPEDSSYLLEDPGTGTQTRQLQTGEEPSEVRKHRDTRPARRSRRRMMPRRRKALDLEDNNISNTDDLTAPTVTEIEREDRELEGEKYNDTIMENREPSEKEWIDSVGDISDEKQDYEDSDVAHTSQFETEIKRNRDLEIPLVNDVDEISKKKEVALDHKQVASLLLIRQAMRGLDGVNKRSLSKFHREVRSLV